MLLGPPHSDITYTRLKALYLDSLFVNFTSVQSIKKHCIFIWTSSELTTLNSIPASVGHLCDFSGRRVWECENEPLQKSRLVQKNMCCLVDQIHIIKFCHIHHVASGKLGCFAWWKRVSVYDIHSQFLLFTFHSTFFLLLLWNCVKKVSGK